MALTTIFGQPVRSASSTSSTLNDGVHILWYRKTRAVCEHVKECFGVRMNEWQLSRDAPGKSIFHITVQ